MNSPFNYIEQCNQKIDNLECSRTLKTFWKCLFCLGMYLTSLLFILAMVMLMISPSTHILAKPLSLVIVGAVCWLSYQYGRITDKADLSTITHFTYGIAMGIGATMLPLVLIFNGCIFSGTIIMGYVLQTMFISAGRIETFKVFIRRWGQPQSLASGGGNFRAQPA